MREFLLILCLISSQSYGQTKEEILYKYETAITSIRTVSYQIQRVDSSLNTASTNKYGEITLMRDEEALTGFKFFATSYDLTKEYIYDGNYEYEIFPKSLNYKKNLIPNHSIFKSPGGLLVVPELMHIDKNYDSFTLLANNNHYVLSFHFPYDSIQNLSNITKIVYLNKETFLPEGIIKDINDSSRKTKYFKFLKNIVINNSKSTKPFKSSHLIGYSEIRPHSPAKHLAHLKYNKTPNMKLKDMDGNIVDINDFYGKVILLDFWATWCKPCIASIPKVQALQDKYNEQGLVVFGILKDIDYKNRAEKILKNNSCLYKNLLITPILESIYIVNPIPQYVIINKKGIITYADTGFSNAIESQIKKALEE